MTFNSHPGGADPYGAIDTITPSATWLYGASGSPSVLAVNQGTIGDCWFEATMVSIAACDPNYIKSMITANGNGFYTVKLYQSGVATYITLDDSLPLGNDGNYKGNWASLIEKAYAATVGSYKAMDGNIADTAFAAITGQSCTSLNINNYDTASIDSQIVASINSHKGVVLYSYNLFIPQAEPPGSGLSGSFPAIDYNFSTRNSEGLVLRFHPEPPQQKSSHVYAIVGYDSTNGNLIVRNPWGYTGPDAYSSAGVTYPNAYISTNTTSENSLTAYPGFSSILTPNDSVNYFSEFEISATDLQYFYGGAITNSALPPVTVINATPWSHANDLSRSGDVKGAYNFIDPLNLEASYGDLIQAFGTNARSMQSWIDSQEATEKRPDIFDGLDYVASYSDLIPAFKFVGSQQAVLDAGASHYITNGVYEGRATIFNGLDYIATYGDLIKAFGVNGDAGAYHYIENGSSEGRTTTFDGLDYIASYSDLIKAFGPNEQAGASHFITNGINEGRKTKFDGLDYIAGYTDLMTAFGANNDAGSAHYITNGLKEGRGASPFNVAAYESAHPDLNGKYATNDAFLGAYINFYVSTGHFLT